MTRTVTIGGFMGVGKTTVGRLLAGRLGVRFVDLDSVIEAGSGRSVSQVFSEDGEEAFRRLEKAALLQVLDGTPVVLALGGGTLHYADNAEVVAKRSDLYVLWSEFSVIAARLGGTDSTRPLWRDAEELFAARADGYRAAGVLVEVGNMPADQVVSQIMESIPCV